MVEISLSLIIGVLGTILGALTGGVFALMLQRRKQPAEDANVVVALTKQLVDLLADHVKTSNDLTALGMQQAVQSADQTHNSGVKDATIAAQAQTIVGLIVKVDGMPQQIAELVAQQLVKNGYILAQREALTAAGVALDAQPVEPAEIPLTPLQPKNLLDILAKEKADAVPVVGADGQPSGLAGE